jgi:hypothetical protein
LSISAVIADESALEAASGEGAGAACADANGAASTSAKATSQEEKPDFKAILE